MNELIVVHSRQYSNVGLVVFIISIQYQYKRLLVIDLYVNTYLLHKITHLIMTCSLYLHYFLRILV